MPNPGAVPVRRRASRTSYIISGALIAVSLILCGGGGAWFAGPAVRAGQESDSAGIGTAVFDMHEGDEYWFYEPVGQSLPDSFECTFGSADDTSFAVRRAERPFSAPATITDLGGEFRFYGTFRGDRTGSFILIDCPFDEYAVTPSRAPLWYLLASVAGGVAAGVFGLAILVVSAIHHRPGTPRSRVAAGAVSSPPLPPAFGGPVPAAAASRPSPLWYTAVLPFGIVAVLACVVGLCGGLTTGFTDSFDAPEVGRARAGTVSALYTYDVDYLLLRRGRGPTGRTGELPDARQLHRGPGTTAGTDRPAARRAGDHHP